jgi:hypothetical protein
VVGDRRVALLRGDVRLLAKLRQDVLQPVGPLLRGFYPQQQVLGII